jgi:signal transduction histidine kinase
MKTGEIIKTYQITNFDKIQLVQLTYSQLYNRKELERSNFELFYLKNFDEGILNNIPMALLVTDTRGNIIFANKWFSNLFKVDPEQFMSQHFNQLLRLSDEHLTVINKGMSSAEVKRIYFQDEAILISNNKVVLDLIPFYDQDNSFLGTIFLFSDLFESVNLEMKIQNIKKMRLLNKSVAGLAHEFRNPLAIISNFLKIIKNTDSFDRIRENTDRIEKEVNRLKEVINNYLKIDHSYMNEQRDYIEVKAFLEDIVNLILPAVKEKNINFEIALNIDAALKIEPDLFKQVVMNLIMNSIEAMSTGGCITIKDEKQQVNGHNYYILNFSDTGIGIKKEDIPRIFEPFFTLKQSDEIRGIGLSICNDIINIYNGFITVDSVWHEGTTFHIYIPANVVVNT